jgi:hypothetical protein
MRDDPIIYTEGIEGVARIAPYVAERWLSLLERKSVVTVNIPASNDTEIHLEELENNETGGYLASSLTSWGPSWELGVKPNLVAPGENILSTYLTSGGSYRVMTGTSMCKKDIFRISLHTDPVTSCSPHRLRFRTDKGSARESGSFPSASNYDNNVKADCLARRHQSASGHSRPGPTAELWHRSDMERSSHYGRAQHRQHCLE